MQLSVHHGFYEALRWHLAHEHAVWHDHELLRAGMRPRNADLLLREARRRQPDMEACIYRTSLRMCMYSTHIPTHRPSAGARRAAVDASARARAVLPRRAR